MAGTILIGVGANLVDSKGRMPLDTCRWAVARLDGLCGGRLRGMSRWFETAPVPVSDQPAFVNGVAHLSGEVEAGALLSALHRLEADAGRVRAAANAARVLDLDLIGMDGLVLDGTAVVPHPRAALRAFVLAPLCDVAPGWVHPVLAQPARKLLAGISMEGVHPLA